MIQEWLVTNSLSCHYGTATGESASMTDQQPALESAGLYGQVESNLPLLPSSLKKVLRGHPSTVALSFPVPPDRVIEWAVIYSYAH
jgi:hypothetical protein